MRSLASWVDGRWVTGSGEGSKLVNPATEEVLALASSAGVDFARLLEAGRGKGGPALRALTFRERGKLLLEVSKAIHAERDALLDLATENGGNTRSDGKFDIDGCTGTLAWYAKLGETLGDKKLLGDGAPEQLGRSPRLVGRHLWAPRAGVAVLINAFNFPAWGMGEKMAAALLAGMPVIAKPATATALVAHRIAEILVGSKLLPEGAFQMVCGDAAPLLDRLDWQDVVAFTGSSATASALRERIAQRGARLGVEADSLNAALVGADVEPGSDTWDLFVREAARDITQKAGQKCTAIRRIFVTKQQLDAARTDLGEALRAVKVGDPTDPEVKMGPLATATQQRDVVAGIEALRRAARPVFGDGGRGGAEGTKGFFVGPTLLEAESAQASVVHEREVFGPVATLLPYAGNAAEAVRALAMGGGALVSSLYTDDAVLAERVIVDGAPYAGRLHLGSEKVAEHSLGPGTVLPQLTHGGPGRAGGGEELGGLRGMGFYMQRVAVQGYQPWLDKLV